MEHIELVTKVLEYNKTNPECSLEELCNSVLPTNEEETKMINIIACVVKSDDTVEVTPESVQKVHKKVLDVKEDPSAFLIEIIKDQFDGWIDFASLLIFEGIVENGNIASSEEIRNQLSLVGFESDKTFLELYPVVYALARKKVLTGELLNFVSESGFNIKAYCDMVVKSNKTQKQ